jgi:hypothetical protein
MLCLMLALVLTVPSNSQVQEDSIQTGPTTVTNQKLNRGVFNQRDGNVEFVSPPARGSKPVCLVRTGDSAVIVDGKPIDICFEGLNPRISVVETTYSPDTKSLKLLVKARNNYVINVTQKCQTFRIGNLTDMPPITVAPYLKAEQIVVTPLCDGNGVRTGYEVRYGTTTAGCQKEARAGLRAFSMCKGDFANPIKTRDVRRKYSVKELMCIYFGVGC